MKVTVKSLALAAGVSRGTVDRVLHNRGSVKPDVAKRVRALAKELGYVPNRAGLALAAHKTPIKIGVLMPSVGNAFYQIIIDGISDAQKEFADLGLNVVIKEIDGFNEDDHLAGIDALIKQGCKGLCLATVNTPKLRDRINQLHDNNVAIVLFNTDVEDTRRLCYVGSDYITAGATCAGMVALSCHEQQYVLVVTGSRNMLGHNMRIKGFEDELKNQKVPYQIISIVECFDSDIRAQQVTSEALKKYPFINCVYITGGAVQGVGSALIAHNDPKIFAMGFDELYATKQLVSEGIIKFVICQQPRRQGYHAVKRAYQAVAGQIIEGNVQDFITETIIKIKPNLGR